MIAKHKEKKTKKSSEKIINAKKKENAKNK
jgi:hypothetical protein